MVVLLPRGHEHHSCKTNDGPPHPRQQTIPLGRAASPSTLGEQSMPGCTTCPTCPTCHPVHTRRCGHLALRGKPGRGDVRLRKQVLSTELGEERGVADCDNLVRSGRSSPVTSQISCLQTGQNSVEEGIPMQKLSGTSSNCFQGDIPTVVECTSQPPSISRQLGDGKRDPITHGIKTRSVTAPVQGRGMSDNGENLV